MRRKDIDRYRWWVSMVSIQEMFLRPQTQCSLFCRAWPGIHDVVPQQVKNNAMERSIRSFKAMGKCNYFKTAVASVASQPAFPRRIGRLFSLVCLLGSIPLWSQQVYVTA